MLATKGYEKYDSKCFDNKRGTINTYVRIKSVNQTILSKAQTSFHKILYTYWKTQNT